MGFSVLHHSTCDSPACRASPSATTDSACRLYHWNIFTVTCLLGYLPPMGATSLPAGGPRFMGDFGLQDSGGLHTGALTCIRRFRHACLPAWFCHPLPALACRFTVLLHLLPFCRFCLYACRSLLCLGAAVRLHAVLNRSIWIA